MLKYVEGFHENGMTISVFEGDDIEWAKSHGFIQADVEEAWDGTFWKIGTAPKTPPKEWEENEYRAKRNKLLQESDVAVLADYPIDKEKLEQVKQYRQALRDITLQTGWPSNIVWPEKPDF